MRYNVLLNALSSTIETRPVGLSDASSRATIIRSPTRNLGATRLMPSAKGHLSLVRGDEALSWRARVVHKNEVEALEMHVLAGLHETVSANRPTLFVEVDDSNRSLFESYIRDHRYAIRQSIELGGNANILASPA